MDEAGKKRLVGAAVVIALVVIFVPMLLEEGNDDGLGDPIHIPARPLPDGGGDGIAAAADPEAALAAAEEDLLLPLPTPEPPGTDPDHEVAADLPTDTGTEPARPPAAEPRVAPAPTASAPPPAPTDSPTEAAPRPVPPGVQSWVVQVASVRQPEAARRLQDELRDKGYPAFVEQAEVNGLTWYRVRIGPEVDRARANEVSARIARETVHKPLVQRYQ